MDGASESDANGVDGGERNNNDEGGPEFVDGGKAGGGVFSERHGGRGDGGRESDDEGDPASDEADGGMKDAAEDLVFAFSWSACIQQFLYFFPLPHGHLSFLRVIVEPIGYVYGDYFTW